MSVHQEYKKITTATLRLMKSQGHKIAMLTAYDYTFARILDAAGIEMILVGDSAANVMAGFDTTIPITLDQMIYHAASVVRGTKRAMVVADLPFGAYQGDERLALASAVRMMKESGVQAVKLEGGSEIVPAVRMLTQSGIPVVGHLGLTPQSIHQLGNFGLRAKGDTEAEKLKSDVRKLIDAGACAIVLEKIPAALAAEITTQVSVPVIGIGAGVGCDGQVLVMHDMLGLDAAFRPKFVKRYLELEAVIKDAVAGYVKDVHEGRFPSEEESY